HLANLLNASGYEQPRYQLPGSWFQTVEVGSIRRIELPRRDRWSLTSDPSFGPRCHLTPRTPPRHARIEHRAHDRGRAAIARRPGWAAARAAAPGASKLSPRMSGPSEASLTSRIGARRVAISTVRAFHQIAVIAPVTSTKLAIPGEVRASTRSASAGT